MSRPRRPHCTATTKRGRPCSRPAMPGAKVCATHAGRAGRKTAATPELVDQLVGFVRAGNVLEVSARAVGVHRSTLSEWLSRGRRGDPAYAELAERVDRALAEAEAAAITRIATAARESWQAAAWYLERAFPERWGRVRVRLPNVPPEEDATPAPPAPLDPFAEIDELAEKRRQRTS